MRDEISSMRTPAAQPVPSRQEEDMRVAVQPHGHSEKASSPDPFADLPALGAGCELYLEDPIRRKVARGTVYKAERVHGIQIHVDQVKVTVTEILVSSAKVPFPTNEYVF
ncbi:PREDICTED: uncharacterized protein LOC109178840 [Ipomoea nil]|uniref:uncharacterized protein LOC109178840 n=1 Tax=Ipomoea nil TaxID=35883 RepID=UPI0009013702|nr:PREDICTED: uncharacterized protein LOC109178840 [Ipomoea nil]